MESCAQPHPTTQSYRVEVAPAIALQFEKEQGDHNSAPGEPGKVVTVNQYSTSS